jgi:hypothetical protein
MTVRVALHGAGQRPNARRPLAEARYRYVQARDNYVLVFLLILVAIALNAAVPVIGVGGLVVTIVQALTLLLALRTSGVRGGALRVLRVLAVCPILAVVIGLLVQRMAVVLYFGGTTLLILSTQAAILVHEIRARKVTADTVMGALSVYLLLGLLFATVDGFYAAAVGPFFAQAGPRQPGDYVYYSFITLCTVGYGDLTPGTAIARILAMAEALLGQLYLVTVIALLVGNLGAQRLHEPSRDRGND